MKYFFVDVSIRSTSACTSGREDTKAGNAGSFKQNEMADNNCRCIFNSGQKIKNRPIPADDQGLYSPPDQTKNKYTPWADPDRFAAAWDAESQSLYQCLWKEQPLVPVVVPARMICADLESLSFSQWLKSERTGISCPLNITSIPRRCERLPIKTLPKPVC